MEMFSPTKQLTLAVQLNQDATFDNFYGEENQKNVYLLKSLISTQDETLIYIAGPSGSGKTHLLCAAISFLEKQDVNQDRDIGYFSMEEISRSISQEDMSEFFVSLESFSFLGLDDIDTWFSTHLGQRAEKERCLFNLFNHFKINNKQLVLSAKRVPAHIQIDLPDLVSRLKSGLLLNLTTLSDEQKESLLQSIAAQKGLSLDEGVPAYIIKRSNRSLSELLDTLDTLDQASLTEKRKITVPFTKKILNW